VESTIFREAYNSIIVFRRHAGFLFWYKKTVIPKKKVFAAQNLKD